MYYSPHSVDGLDGEEIFECQFGSKIDKFRVPVFRFAAVEVTAEIGCRNWFAKAVFK